MERHESFKKAFVGTVVGTGLFAGIAGMFVEIRSIPRIALRFALISVSLTIGSFFYSHGMLSLLTILSVPVLWAAVPLTTTIGVLAALIMLMVGSLTNHTQVFWCVATVLALSEVLVTGEGLNAKVSHFIFLVAAFLPIELNWIYSPEELVSESLYCNYRDESSCKSFKLNADRQKKLREDESFEHQEKQRAERYVHLSTEEKTLYDSCSASALPDESSRHPEACDKLDQVLHARCGEQCARQMYLDQCADGNILGCFRASAFFNNKQVNEALHRECFFQETASAYLKDHHFSFPLACDALVTLYQRLSKTEPSNEEYRHKIDFYAKGGCKQGTPYSCYVHGSQLLAARDMSGLDALRTSCESGFKYACEYLEKNQISSGTAINSSSNSGP